MPRIFIGIKMPEKIESLAAAWAEDKRDWPVRWVRAKNLHLTLVPPFYEDDIKMIAGRLGEIKPLKAPARLHFHTISYGLGPKDYRLIWAVGQPSPELENLKTKIEKKLNLRIERRKFLPHLTLARFRREDYNKLKIKNLNEQIGWKEEAKGFAMFESILKPEGAEYEIIRSF